MAEPVQHSGLFASLRRLLATALEMAQVRLEIISTEVELEKRRIFDGLLWGALALLFLGLGLVMLCGLVILMFWEGYRMTALGLMMLLFLATGALLMQQARHRLRNATGMLETTLAELKQDRTGMPTLSPHEPE